MNDPDKIRTCDLVSILLFFILLGIGIGSITGVRAVLQNGYLSHGMTEIMFWTIVKSIDHHLLIFFAIAVCNIMAYAVFRTLGVSVRNIVDISIIPFSVASIFFIYGRPLWVVFRQDPGRLFGKTETMIFLGIAALIILFLPLWYFRLRTDRSGFWTGRFLPLFTRRTTIIIAAAVIVGTHILDAVDWSRSGRSATNLVMISLDTLRADHLGCYGHGRDISPQIDGFAGESIQFMKAISQSSWTLPSHASLFTGFYPSAIGAVNRHRSVPASYLLLGELLRNAGYETAAFTGGGYLNPIFGFAQGFDTYEHCTALDSEPVWRFIDETGDRPFFLFLHTYKIHNYFVPPEWNELLDEAYREEFQSLSRIMAFVDRHLVEDLDDQTRPKMEYLRDRYALSILHMDGQFGSLMEGLGERDLLDKTLIVLFSDHGEEFGEHGRTYHGGTLYTEQIHVPLIIRLPGGERGGSRIPEIVELMDVFPTILEYLDIRPPEGIDGESLVPLIDGGEGDAAGIAFSEISSLVTEKYSVCDSGSKLIYAPAAEDLELPGDGNVEAFELTWGADWREEPRANEADSLAEPFQRWYTKMIRLRRSGSESDEVLLDPDLQEELRALGYVQ